MNASVINSTKESISSYETKMETIFSDLKSSWKGESFDNYANSYSEIKNSFFSTIKKQLDLLKSAIDKYNEYKNLKKELENVQTSSDDNSNLAEINRLEQKLKNLKTEIENKLSEVESLIIILESKSNSATSYTSESALDMNNYPKGNSHEAVVARATLVAKYLMQNGGLTAVQAAALVGVFIDENGCDPGTVMQAEKDGLGAAGTGGNGYGAGIGSWTHEGYKNQCLNDAGYPSGTLIESLSLEEQCNIIIASSKNSSSAYYNALKRCDNIEDASATAQVLIEGVGHSNNWSTHPTTDEAKAVSDYYANYNDKQFGYSPYHHGMYERRLDYAKEIYQILNN